MRGFILGALFALAICAPACLFAEDAVVPPQTTTPPADMVNPLPPPSIIVSPTPTKPPHTPLTPTPYGQVASPIEPSKPPTGYVTQPVQPVIDNQSNFIRFSADQIRTSFDNGVATQTIAEGHVTACFRDVIITSDRAQASYKTNIAVFEGNVVYKTGVETVTGSSLILNLKTRAWELGNADTTIRPEFTKGYLVAPVFASGQKIWGLRQKNAFASETEATTCNLSEPHYDLIARSLAVYPDNKLVMRHVTFVALGHKLFTLPRFVIPIKDIYKNPELIPKFGQTAEEGPYLKCAYPYMGTATQSGILLLDLMSRKGVGEGIRHTYNFGKASGDVRFYHIFDNNINQDTITGRIDHNQELGTVKLNFTSDFRSNSYLYAAQSKSTINQLTLTRMRPGANSSFIVSQNINDAITRTVQLNSTLSHRQNFGIKTSLNTVFDYNSYDTGSQTTARLTSQMDFARKENKFDWGISAQKLTDLSDEAFVGSSTFAGIEKLPELSLLSDTARLGNVLPFGIPANFKLSYGKYDELPANTFLDRAFLEVASPAKIRPISHTWSSVLGAGFRQYVYGDNTAQYSFDTSAELNKKLGHSSLFALTYRFQRPQGFTPFRFDYVGRYNVVNTRLDVKDSEKFKLSLLTGYNFEQSNFPWQDAVIRFSVQPTTSFLFYTATSYDFNRGQWRTIINQYRIRVGQTFKLDIGSRYDPTQGKLASIKTQLETPIDRKTRISASTGYNGFTHKYDYQNFRITRDLHCWEASVVYNDQTGFYTNQGFSFNIRIKAFPSYDEYGVGAFGEALDTSVGNVYGF